MADLYRKLVIQVCEIHYTSRPRKVVFFFSSKFAITRVIIASFREKEANSLGEIRRSKQWVRRQFFSMAPSLLLCLCEDRRFNSVCGRRRYCRVNDREKKEAKHRKFVPVRSSFNSFLRPSVTLA